LLKKNIRFQARGDVYLDSKPLYNSRIIDSYIKYIKKCYEHVNVDEIYDYAQMEPYEVADQNHWFSQKQVDLFYEKVTALTGSANIAREAGRYAASPESIGVMRQYVLGMANPGTVYKMIGKVASQFSRSAKYESKEINSKKIEIVVTPNEGVQEKPFQCENRIGHFESIALMFNNSIPRIEHTECLFKGGGAVATPFHGKVIVHIFLKEPERSSQAYSSLSV